MKEDIKIKINFKTVAEISKLFLVFIIKNIWSSIIEFIEWLIRQISNSARKFAEDIFKNFYSRLVKHFGCLLFLVVIAVISFYLKPGS